MSTPSKLSNKSTPEHPSAPTESPPETHIETKTGERFHNHVILTERRLEDLDLHGYVLDESCGAVSSFVGMTRNHHQGRSVTKLCYEAYHRMATHKILQMCAVVRRRWDVGHIVVAHRLGEVGVSQASVWIAVSSVHRRESLEATSFSINFLKQNIPIWKQEWYGEQSLTDSGALKKDALSGTDKASKEDSDTPSSSGAPAQVTGDYYEGDVEGPVVGGAVNDNTGTHGEEKSTGHGSATTRLSPSTRKQTPYAWKSNAEYCPQCVVLRAQQLSQTSAPPQSSQQVSSTADDVPVNPLLIQCRACQGHREPSSGNARTSTGHIVQDEGKSAESAPSKPTGGNDSGSCRSATTALSTDTVCSPNTTTSKGRQEQTISTEDAGSSSVNVLQGIGDSLSVVRCPLNVTDIVAAHRFYTLVLGCRSLQFDADTGTATVQPAGGGPVIELDGAESGQRRAQALYRLGEPALILQVTDAHGQFTKLQEAGVTVTEVGGWAKQIARFTVDDGCGNLIELRDSSTGR